MAAFEAAEEAEVKAINAAAAPKFAEIAQAAARQQAHKPDGRGLWTRPRAAPKWGDAYDKSGLELEEEEVEVRADRDGDYVRQQHRAQAPQATQRMQPQAVAQRVPVQNGGSVYDPGPPGRDWLIRGAYTAPAAAQQRAPIPAPTPPPPRASVQNAPQVVSMQLFPCPNATASEQLPRLPLPHLDCPPTLTVAVLRRLLAMQLASQGVPTGEHELKLTEGGWPLAEWQTVGALRQRADARGTPFIVFYARSRPPSLLMSGA